MSRKNILLVTSVIVAGLVVIALYFFFHGTGPKYSTKNTVFTSLTKDNPDFKNGLALAKQGDFKDALSAYAKAMAAAGDDAQRAQISFDIGLAQAGNGDAASAVQTFKTIAANTANDPIVRSYAVQEMGLMHYRKPADQSLTAAIFNGDPYKSFVSTSTTASYRNLFHYATTIYPLSLSYAYIAYGYAADLRERGGATTTPTGEQDVAEIQSAFTAAKKDFPRFLSRQEEASYVPAFYLREAATVAYLASLHVDGFTNDSADTLYTRMNAAAGVAGAPKGNFYSYQYAVFLGTVYGKSRTSDIASLLSAFSTGAGSDIDPLLADTLKAAATDPLLDGFKANVTILARLDPDFKTYLLSHGWTSAQLH